MMLCAIIIAISLVNFLEEIDRASFELNIPRLFGCQKEGKPFQEMRDEEGVSFN